MKQISFRYALPAAVIAAWILSVEGPTHFAFGQTVAPAPAAIATVPGMAPVPDPANLYSETIAAKLSPAVAGDLPRVYVPHVKSNDVYVIDPATMKVVDRFTGRF